MSWLYKHKSSQAASYLWLYFIRYCTSNAEQTFRPIEFCTHETRAVKRVDIFVEIHSILKYFTNEIIACQIELLFVQYKLRFYLAQTGMTYFAQRSAGRWIFLLLSHKMERLQTITVYLLKTISQCKVFGQYDFSLWRTDGTNHYEDESCSRQ